MAICRACGGGRVSTAAGCVSRPGDVPYGSEPLATTENSAPAPPSRYERAEPGAHQQKRPWLRHRRRRAQVKAEGEVGKDISGRGPRNEVPPNRPAADREAIEASGQEPVTNEPHAVVTPRGQDFPRKAATRPITKPIDVPLTPVCPLVGTDRAAARLEVAVEHESVRPIELEQHSEARRHVA